MFQLQIDDNLFNSFSSVFTSVDKSFSLRELMKNNPKTKPMVNAMTTNMIAPVIPTFTEEYGDNKNLDIMFSLSHSLFQSGFPNSKMSGMYIDKNGNWKMQANLVLNLNVETTRGNWESAREVYLTTVFKFKVSVNSTNPFSKKFALTPKNLEITNLKVLMKDKEMEMEQMMIQSVVNIQLENFKKQFREYPFHMQDLLSKNPKELQCLGFNVADLDVTFKKSQVQLSTYFKYTKYSNKTLCDKFLAELRESPNKILDQINLQKDNPLMKGFEEAQRVAAGNSSANPFEALGGIPDLSAPAADKPGSKGGNKKAK